MFSDSFLKEILGVQQLDVFFSGALRLYNRPKSTRCFKMLAAVVAGSFMG